MPTVERQPIVDRTTLDISHLPRAVFEEESNIAIPALTGSVILGVIEENGLTRKPLEGFQGGWVEYMPGPLLDSVLGADPTRILEESRRRLDDYDLGIYEQYRDQVAAGLDLLLERGRRRNRTSGLLETAGETELLVYQNHGNAD